MICITSRRHNFRRCGMPHPKGAVDYPDDKFSEEELETLRAEPMLTVEDLEEEKKGPKVADPEKMTVAELRTELALFQEFVPARLIRSEYVEMLSAHREAKGS